MFRSLTTRPGRGYEKLPEEKSVELSSLATKLDRARSLPAKFFSGSGKSSNSDDYEQKKIEKSVSKQAKKVSKIHPLFNFVDSRLRKKATAKPEVSRYLQYLKEGGNLYSISESSSS